MVTVNCSSGPSAYGPAPAITSYSGHEASIVPLRLPAPVFRNVKLRSAELPSSTDPKSRLVLSKTGFGGAVV